MAERQITLVYRKLLNAQSAHPWDNLVVQDTYAEFRLQAQIFNPEKRYRTYAELRQHAPGAEQLPFLVSSVVRGYLPQLNGIVPDITNNLGRYFLRFTKFKFELIDSDLLDSGRHQIAINFYSEPLIWHETVGNYLIVADKTELPANAGEILTHVFQLSPYLSIYSLQPAAHL